MNMRILVTGSRDWTDRDTIYSALEEARGDVPHDQIVLVHGKCPTGADEIAAHYAEVMDWGIDPHPAKWDKYGRKAGIIRNVEMVNAVVAVRHLEPVVCLGFIKDYSHGSTHCATYAGACGIEVRIFRA